MKNRRIAVWGLGRHARLKMLPAILAEPGMDLVGVCSRNESVVAETAAAYGCQGWSAPGAMLADPLVDIVYVSTPIALHPRHARQVLEAGKHLWCEKPLAWTAGDAQRLTTLARERGLTVFECFMYLHHPQFHRMAELIRAGSIGRVSSVTCRFGLPPLDVPGFRGDPVLGGDALLDVGCYPVSLLLALVPGAGWRVAHAWSALEGNWVCETSGGATLRGAGGESASLEWRINASYRNDVDVWGSAGSLFADRIFSKPSHLAPALQRRDLRGAETWETIGAADHFALMLSAFRSIMEDDSAVEAERSAVRDRAALLEAIRRAADGEREDHGE